MLKGYRTYIVLAIALGLLLTSTIIHCAKKPSNTVTVDLGQAMGKATLPMATPKPDTGFDWELWINIGVIVCTTLGIVYRALAAKRYSDMAAAVIAGLQKIAPMIPNLQAATVVDRAISYMTNVMGWVAPAKVDLTSTVPPAATKPL